MIDIDVSFFIQIVNFLITWMLLNLVLIGPIRGIIRKRAEFTATQVEAIERFNLEAVTKVKDYETQLTTARKAGMEERSRQKDLATAEEASVVDAAAKKAAETVSAARTAVSSQMDAAMKSLTGEVDKLAARAVDKILA